MEITDSQIEMLVQKNIDHDPILDSDSIYISVTNGVVVLKGYVRTALERYAAIKDATVSGAKHINAEYLHVL